MTRDIELARRIVEHLGVTISNLEEIHGPGEVNHVFRADTADGKWIVRFGKDTNSFGTFDQEAWCLSHFAESQVNVPELVTHDTFEDVSFIVYQYVEGQNADQFRTTELCRTLGRYARIINETIIDDTAPDSLFPRFGRDLAQNWQAHLDYNLDELTPNDPLIKLGVYAASQQDQIKAIIAKLGDQVNAFGLTHGDLVPKNVIISPSGQLTVIDWGSASTGPTPHADLMRIWASPAPESYTPRELASFAEGYGIVFESFRQTLTEISLLNNLDIVRWAIDRRPDLLQAKVETSQAAIQAMLRAPW